MTRRKNLLIIVLLLASLAICFPILVSLVADYNPRTLTAIIFPSPTVTATNTHTPTATPTLTPTRTATPASTATPSPTTTPLPRVYLNPMRQIWGVGQTQIFPTGQIRLYQGGVEPFIVIGSQDNFIRLQSLDGATTFWTGIEVIATTPPTAARFDYSQRGKTATLIAPAAVACSYDSAAVIVPCQTIPNAATALYIAQVTAGTMRLHLVEIIGIQYLVPFEAVGRIF